ncbi:MAG: aminomethyltransferase family protein [Roseovarius sp.]|nr:aminomethyltransferase family protein [Roseovarius sp.]
MRVSSDGKTRDLVTSRPGAGWDFGIDRHPYTEHERPLGPHYCVYNRRLMACELDAMPEEEGYWLLRTRAALLHTGELPLEFRGPDAEKLLDYLFANNVRKIRPGRCGYGIACLENGGMIVDGILLRFADDHFWYVQADGDFLNWARAFSRGMNVGICDPRVYVSQIQGPNSIKVLADAATGGLPESFGYFGIAQVDIGGQKIWITRTGYTNELGWEFYTEPHHDPDALWRHLSKAGEVHGLKLFGLDSMNIRRIEAGILNAGSDFDETTTPFEVGLGRFVDMKKSDFIGKSALEFRPGSKRLHGILCDGGKPKVSGRIELNGQKVGRVTCGAYSPYLEKGVGMALMDSPSNGPGSQIMVETNDGGLCSALLEEMPFYDKACDIPRGITVDIPGRPA